MTTTTPPNTTTGYVRRPSMTPHRLNVLRFVVDHHDRKGYSPTLKETAAAFGRATITVYEALQRLVAHGYLQRVPGRISRNYVPTVQGRIAAGGIIAEYQAAIETLLGALQRGDADEIEVAKARARTVLETFAGVVKPGESATAAEGDARHE